MKNLVFAILTFIVLFTACSKKEPVNLTADESVKLHYDTTAIDSFSKGAISVDIVRKIKMSSQHYQDSLKEALKLQAEEKKIKTELEKENKKKLDEEKKKSDEEKKKKAAENSLNETKTE